MNMDEKLKLCPFCGGKAYVYIDPAAMHGWTVSCYGCLAIMRGFQTEQEAIEAWNKRT